jgi:hypothetical protein
VSEDYQWRQLGSIVNTVLIDAKAKAIHKGAFSKLPLDATPRNAQHLESSPQERQGNGFLSAARPAASGPVQLELPFGIAAAPQTSLHEQRAPHTAVLM